MNHWRLLNCLFILCDLIAWRPRLKAAQLYVIVLHLQCGQFFIFNFLYLTRDSSRLITDWNCLIGTLVHRTIDTWSWWLRHWLHERQNIITHQILDVRVVTALSLCSWTDTFPCSRIVLPWLLLVAQIVWNFLLFMDYSTRWSTWRRPFGWEWTFLSVRGRRRGCDDGRHIWDCRWRRYNRISSLHFRFLVDRYWKPDWRWVFESMLRVDWWWCLALTLCTLIARIVL